MREHIKARVIGLCGLLLVVGAVGCVATGGDDEFADDEFADDELGQIEQSICADPPCEGDPEGGGQRPVPAAPRVIAGAWSSTFGTGNLTVQWTIESGWTHFTVEKRPFGGSWTFFNGGPNPNPGTRSLTDHGKTADSRWCYRLRATNAAGSGTSPQACGLTPSPASETNPELNRLQLRIEVADVTDAGSESKVSSRLNSLSFPPMHFNALNPAPRKVNGNWVDSFERNVNFVYELELKEARRLRDITEISIRNWGDDALCIERAVLLVNGQVVLNKLFGLTASTCRWIETDSGGTPEVVIPFEELRATPGFTNFVNPDFSPSIPRAEIEARVEAVVGNLIWGERARWGKFSGDRAVEAQFVGPQTLHVDLDLEGLVGGPLPNVEIDLDFDAFIELTGNATNGWNLRFDIFNLGTTADFPWWAETVVFALGAIGVGVYDIMFFIERYIEDAIEEQFDLEAQEFPLGEGCPSPFRTTVRVTPEAGLQFECVP
jgi:hypothetical protein